LIAIERFGFSNRRELLGPTDATLHDPLEEGPPMTVTGIITALIVGLIIGALGRLVVPGKQNIPIWLTMVVGVVAALLGTVIARAMGFADTGGIDWRELLIQVVLAAIGVALVAGVGGRRRLTR
jgi:uncharacterized membrane protein YeaQ/YmgE (transglycosylase-associated protein family)